MWIEQGEKVKQLRLDKNLMIRDLHNITGLAESQITNVEKGRRKPSVITVKKLADGLQCSFDVIYNLYYQE